MQRTKLETQQNDLMKNLILLFTAVLTMLCLFPSNVFSGTNSTSQESISQNYKEIFLKVPFEYNYDIYRSTVYAIRRDRVKTEKILGRAEYYFPLIERIFEKYGIPKEIKNLAIVESGLNSHALSPAGAKGFWQFMKGTAPMYGLKVNSQVDERTDIYKSTVAAAQYLSEMYAEFGDWLLAMASYNCGPGNVRKAIKRAGGAKDYWKVRKYLPKETQKYIPRFFAAVYMNHFFPDYGLNPIEPDLHISVSRVITVNAGSDLEWFAYDFNYDLGELYLLNPHLIKEDLLKQAERVTLPHPREVQPNRIPGRARPNPEMVNAMVLEAQKNKNEAKAKERRAPASCLKLIPATAIREEKLIDCDHVCHQYRFFSF